MSSFFSKSEVDPSYNNYLRISVDGLNDYIYSGSGYWEETNSTITAGKHQIEMEFVNNSSLGNAPIIYIDHMSGLMGIVPADRDGDGVANVDDLFPDRTDAATDADGDGIGDEWELKYFNVCSYFNNICDYANRLNTYSADGDFDNDGLNDVDEFIAGTRPYDGDSDNDGPYAYEEYECLLGYLPVEYCNDDSVDLFPADSRYHDDTDGDGLPDEWELRHFSALVVSDGTQDSDGDSLTDVQEFALDSMPAVDTDADGYADVVDAFPNDNRYGLDADNDGIPDEWENQYSHVSNFSAEGDYDQDYRTDLNEFLSGTNPTVIDINAATDTDNDGLGDEWEMASFESLDIADAASDFDDNGVTDLSAFQNNTAISDADVDGVADYVDAFPNDSRYALDDDDDEIADEWENNHGGTYRFTAEGDYDNDGRLDLKEFIDGTNPTILDLRAVEDIIVVVKGQTVSFDPTENDLSNREAITVSSVESPDAGSLVNNLDGTYTYTATSDRLGWLRLVYTANDGESNALGEIFINIMEQAPAQVVRIDGINNGMALFDDGALYTVTYGANGQYSYASSKVAGLPAIKDFTSAKYQNINVALSLDGDVWYWSQGATAVKLEGTGAFEGLAMKDYAVYLLKADGTVVVADTHSGAPGSFTPVNGMANIKQIDAGDDHLLALAGDGLVWALGYGDAMGTGSNGSSSIAVQVSKISNIESIEASNRQSFAIDDQGRLFAWGENYSGQLGDGTNTRRNVPVLVEALSNVVEVKSGDNHTLVRLADGSLYGMGNSSYLNGHGGSTPSLITDLLVASIGASSHLSFIIGVDGLGYSFASGVPQEIIKFQYGAISELGKEGFEWGRVPPYWLMGSYWKMVQNESNIGSYSVKVKDSLYDNVSAHLGLEISTGAGDVSFSIKTSTEADYDELIFYIDGVEQARYSGENDWVDTVAISIDAGVHSFKWVYQKDGGTSVGDDTVWLDDIQLPVDSDGDGIIDYLDPQPYIPAAP